ncbi:MAG TPA: hypothetical protein VIU12_04890, partial [Chryseolinea sp.]
MSFADEKWAEAEAVLHQRKDEFDWVLVPREFQGQDGKFRPLEYSESALPGRVGFLCHKDFSGQLSSSYRERTGDAAKYRFANEVFVLGGLEDQTD